MRTMIAAGLLVLMGASSVGAADCSAWVSWRREIITADFKSNFEPAWIYKARADCEGVKQRFLNGGKWVRSQPGHANDSPMEFLCLPVLQDPPAPSQR